MLARADSPVRRRRRTFRVACMERMGWLAHVTGGSLRRARATAERARERAGWARGLADAELRDAAASVDLLAVLGEVAERTIGQRPFDQQLLACAALLDGTAVEQDTGEGKTLVGALAAAGFAIGGRRVHVLSVNDYLARRDAEWMSPLFDALGLRVGWIGQHTTAAERRDVYRREVVYAPVSEVGYDVLRDRFATTMEDRVAPALDVAVVDEADAVMIDEAISPLVLAGSDDALAEDVGLADSLVRTLRAGHGFRIDDDLATVSLTDEGLDLLEQRLGGVNLFDEEHAPMLTRINLALHAHVLVQRDVDYIVADDTIRLVNAARGRVAHLQRWPDGLHAAIEAKERVPVSSPGIVLDSLTVQDLLRSYRTLTGMSGTLVAVAEELAEFYDIGVARIERRLPNRRVDEAPYVVSTAAERLAAVVDRVVARHGMGQPVLVGTQSVAESEEVAAALATAGVEGRVLNARNDAHEASVIAAAGEFGAVTVSTQLSGRGTDIRLGGPGESDRDRVVAAGGLHVVAMGRYPSSRLDAQLRGRAGRQGDPGSSTTIVSVQDELVQAHAPAHLLAKAARNRDPRVLARIVDDSQRIAEGVRRDRHRATWDFHRAIARQRDTVLATREEAMRGEAERELQSRIPSELRALRVATDAERLSLLVRDVVLWCLDDGWSDHLARLAEVRDGIHLQALAGVNPRDAFHAIALKEFHGFFDSAFDRAAAIIGAATPAQVAGGAIALGLRRPSATWTYMVRDDPLGSPMDRAARHAGRWFRRRVLRVE